MNPDRLSARKRLRAVGTTVLGVGRFRKAGLHGREAREEASRLAREEASRLALSKQKKEKGKAKKKKKRSQVVAIAPACAPPRSLSDRFKETKFVPSNILNFLAGDFVFERPTMIRTFMYLGDRDDALRGQMLKAKGITHILNVTGDIPNYHEGDFEYCRLKIDDNPKFSIRKHFDRAIQFISSARTSGGKILVHCRAGVSRSTSCCLAYMIYAESMPLKSAYSYIHRRRPIVCPNETFLLDLADFEVAVLNGSSVAMETKAPWNFVSTRWKEKSQNVPILSAEKECIIF